MCELERPPDSGAAFHKLLGGQAKLTAHSTLPRTLSQAERLSNDGNAELEYNPGFLEKPSTWTFHARAASRLHSNARSTEVTR
jgi:hypothetical protein